MGVKVNYDLIDEDEGFFDGWTDEEIEEYMRLNGYDR